MDADRNAEKNADRALSVTNQLTYQRLISNIYDLHRNRSRRA